MEIYDRYGGLIFPTTGPDVHWDGQIAGKAANAGVYAYVLRYVDIYGVAGLNSGLVTVLP